ncbi:hypothetical protein K435DRAFT_683334, partial [Dendrothele bispora CBS 962.96]
LRNFYHLVASTNIVSAYSVSDSEADEYLNHYTEYRKTRAEIYAGKASKPNHHYAMHNAELMKLWGPLSLVSEFSGEQINGMLQGVETNNHMCK